MNTHTTATTLYDDDLQTLIRACVDDPDFAADVLRRLDVATKRQRRDIGRAVAFVARQARSDARLRRIASRNTRIHTTQGEH